MTDIPGQIAFVMEGHLFDGLHIRRCGTVDENRQRLTKLIVDKHQVGEQPTADDILRALRFTHD